MMTEVIDRLSRALADRYRIEREIGAGGMATVYLAEDVRHRRRVAVKVLRPELAAILGADRFLKEIEVTANLQHPNILPLYDSGEVDTFLFYVMPYIEGESLRHKLNRDKQLGVAETIQIAQSVAAALDYAHRQAVVHRDIKPENVLLYEGQALVADFGIALAVSQAGGTRITETGLSIGTPHYMSPEQASADRELDGRTDIYSLGAMTYEMLVGRPPFDAASVQAVMSKILTATPRRVREERPTVPSNVDAAIHVALAKLPADRFPTGAQFAEALTNPAFRTPAEGFGQRTTSARLHWRAWAVIAVLAVLAGWGWLRQTTVPDSDRPLRLAFEVPDGQLLAWGAGPTLAIAPDGNRLVYAGMERGQRRLYLRDLDAFGARPLNGTEGAQGPFLSPDGAIVGYFADDALWRVPAAGGIPTRIAQLSDYVPTASWGDDGTILYGGDGWSVWRVRANGTGTPERIAMVRRDGDEAPEPPENGSAMWPDHLPGNRALVVIAFPSVFGIVDLSTGEFRSLAPGNRPYYLPSGHIVFYSGGETVSVVPFDIERGRLTGPVEPVVDDADRPGGSVARFVVSKTGTLAYATGGFDRRLVIVEQNGRASELDAEPRGYRFPSVSPDGNWLAVTVDPQPPAIWMVDMRRMTAQPLTSDGYNLVPRWSPDGTRLSFRRLNPNSALYWVRWPEGGDFHFIASGFIGEGTWIDSTHMIAVGLEGDLIRYDLEAGVSSGFLVTPFQEAQPRLSPNGRWLAYTSDVSGQPNVYVLPTEGRAAPTSVSSGGGVEPHWSRDGSRIFFRRGDGIFDVAVRTSPDFAVLRGPELLFSGNFDFSNDLNWDVLPDGRFLMIRSSPKVGREVRIMVNWLQEFEE